MNESSTAKETGFTKAHAQTVIDIADIELAAYRTEPDYGACAVRLQNPNTVRLLHAAMGLATESAEFLDMLKKHIFYGKPVDVVNAVEEMGDASWYQRIGCDAAGVSFLEMLLLNVRKLRARFPEKFTQDLALNRDLDRERDVLEGGDLSKRLHMGNFGGGY